MGLRAKGTTGEKEDHFIMTEEYNFVYTNTVSNCVKQIELKEVEKS